MQADDSEPGQLPLFPESTLDDKPLSEVKKLTAVMAEKGGHCPCCQQFVKLYRRRLGSSMARALVHLHRHLERPGTEDKWVHLPTYLTKNRLPRSDEAKLVHWGILESLRADRDDGSSRNGYYQITELGKKFVKNEIRVPKYIWIYNQSVYGFSDGQARPLETISIIEALGAKFSYRELMEG